MKKILFLIASLTLIFSLLCIPSLAAVEFTASEAKNEAEETDTFPNEEGSGEYENPLESLYSVILENSDKLLSALSFIGTLIIMLVYKKGLLPLLRGGMSAISKGVGEVEAQAKRQGEDGEALHQLISSRLAAGEGAIERIEETVGTLEARCVRAMQSGKSSSAIFNAIQMQSELLYEILLASSLPSYEKERVSERIAEIKATLADGGDSGDEIL